MTLDEQIAATRADIQRATEMQRAAQAAMRDLRKLKYPEKCCRCWPNSISDDGYCTCCDYDHAKGERVQVDDPLPEI